MRHRSDRRAGGVGHGHVHEHEIRPDRRDERDLPRRISRIGDHVEAATPGQIGLEGRTQQRGGHAVRVAERAGAKRREQREQGPVLELRALGPHARVQRIWPRGRIVVAEEGGDVPRAEAQPGEQVRGRVKAGGAEGEVGPCAMKAAAHGPDRRVRAAGRRGEVQVHGGRDECTDGLRERHEFAGGLHIHSPSV